MWTQKVEYVDVEITLPSPVKKQVWDGEKFVPMTLYKHKGLLNSEPMTLYKHKGLLNSEKLRWLEKTYGQPGTYINGRFWDYSRAGNFTVIDEKVYTWFQMKWGNK